MSAYYDIKIPAIMI